MKNGNKNHDKRKTAPAKNINISAKIPIKIKRLLITAPKVLEIKLEKKTSEYFAKSKPLGYSQIYLLQ